MSLDQTTVDVYSHGIKVETQNHRVREALKEYCFHNLAEWGYSKPRRGQPPKRTIQRIYAAATASRREFRFHRNCLEDLLNHLNKYGVYRNSIEFRNLPVPTPTAVALPVKEGIVPREDQEPVVEVLSDPTRPTKVVPMQTGKGKDQSLDSLIKVPGGWKRMGDMEIGDTVTAWDGSPSKVQGIYPQGRKQLYRVTFADGRSTKAGPEHLWRVYYVNTQPHKRWRTVTTLEMLRLISMPNPRVYVPLNQSEQGPDVNLPIPPYTMGAVLGDGRVYESSITITKNDPFIFERVQSELPNELGISPASCENRAYSARIQPVKSRDHNAYRESFEGLGLSGLKSYEKFIPEIYLHGSTEQRLALLNGLLDTDGTVNTSGSISFSSTSYELAQGVQYLVRSLGGIASIATRSPNYTHNGIRLSGRIAYQVNIRHPHPSTLFTLPRKKERINDDNQYSSSLKLRVTSVEPESVEETQCISIDHPEHLYITDDFTVTHNTLVSLVAAARLGWRTMISIQGGYVGRWLEGIDEVIEVTKKDIWVIRGRDALKTLINRGLNDDIDAKFIIITWKTLYNFFKEYEKSPTDNQYGLSPERLCEITGVGTRIVDEVHKDYHFNFRSDIYTNVATSIFLSATLDTEDPQRKRMYDIAMPEDHWHKGADYDAYIGAYAIQYYADGDPERIITQEPGRDTYSHGAYEKWIMKENDRLARYFDLILWVVQKFHVENDYHPGQKGIIFCSLQEFCGQLAEEIQKTYPEWAVRVFIDETPETVLEEADLIVTTVESAGTALDIPDLKFGLLTRALRKKETNEQVKGRLRKLKKWPDQTPIFAHLVNLNIPKHVEYMEAKFEQFNGRVLFHERITAPLKV